MTLNRLFLLGVGSMLFVSMGNILNYKMQLASISNSVCGNITGEYDFSALLGSCDVYCYAAIASLLLFALGSMYEATRISRQNFWCPELIKAVYV